MLKRAKQLSELSFFEMWTVFLALFLLPAVAWALHKKGFNWTRSFLERYSAPKTQATTSLSEQLAIAQSITRAIAIAANHGPWRANCLQKSLLSWWLLARRGIQSDIKLGVNKNNGEFSAHSWLELYGTVLNDVTDVDLHFATFDSE